MTSACMCCRASFSTSEHMESISYFMTKSTMISLYKVRMHSLVHGMEKSDWSASMNAMHVSLLIATLINRRRPAGPKPIHLPDACRRSCVSNWKHSVLL